MVKETGGRAVVFNATERFQSPLGEVVKETIVQDGEFKGAYLGVSIPSRGSGKGDTKLTLYDASEVDVSIPSRGSGKGDQL